MNRIVPEDIGSLVAGDSFGDVTAGSDGDSSWMTKIDVTNFAQLTHPEIKYEDDDQSVSTEDTDPTGVDSGSYGCATSSASLSWSSILSPLRLPYEVEKCESSSDSITRQKPLPSPAGSMNQDQPEYKLQHRDFKPTPLIHTNRPMYLSTHHAPHAMYLPTKGYPKPIYSYSCLIALALKNSKSGKLTVAEIYNFMCENFPYFRTAPSGWKNSVRHNLSLNKCFEKIEIEAPGGHGRKSCLWCLNPNKVNKMDSEVRKWREKDPQGVRESLTNPDDLESIERGTKGLPTEQAGFMYNDAQMGKIKPPVLMVRTGVNQQQYGPRYANSYDGRPPPGIVSLQSRSQSWSQSTGPVHGSAPKIPRLLCRSRTQTHPMPPQTPPRSMTDDHLSPSAYSTPIQQPQQLGVTCPAQSSPFNNTPPYSPNLASAAPSSLLTGHESIQWCQQRQYISPQKSHPGNYAQMGQSPYALAKLTSTAIPPDGYSPSHGLFTACYNNGTLGESVAMSPCRLLNSSFGSSNGGTSGYESQQLNSYEVTQAALNNNSLLQSALMQSPCKPLSHALSEPMQRTVTLQSL